MVFQKIAAEVAILFSKVSTVCVVLDILSSFFLGKTIQIISDSVDATSSATILAHSFSSVKEISIYFKTNIAKLNSCSSISAIVKHLTLLTRAKSTGK